jgi:hypothetical protein
MDESAARRIATLSPLLLDLVDQPVPCWNQIAVFLRELEELR